MKKKLLHLTFFIIVVDLVLVIFLPRFGIVISSLTVLAGVFAGILLMLNNAYKYTNNWKNRFVFKSKFISGKEYRENHGRNYDVVNLGSNPAYYGFFYEDVRGQNWSTGSQGFEMDFEILKLYHSYLRENGIVLIPIMPFSAVSQYIKTKSQYWNDFYYVKFASILDGAQTRNLPNGRKVQRLLKYPLFYKPSLMKYLIVDNRKDERLNIAEQTMSKIDIEYDATRMLHLWFDEFDAKSLDDFIGLKYDTYIEEAKTILDEMIQFCIERSYKPVLITVPMTMELTSRFTKAFHQKMIIDFVQNLSHKNIKFLDYMQDKELQKSELFNGAFCMNLNGRKLFTRKVIRDLGIEPIVEKCID